MRDELIFCTAFSSDWCWTIKDLAPPGSHDARNGVVGRAPSEPGPSHPCDRRSLLHSSAVRQDTALCVSEAVAPVLMFWKNKERKYLSSTSRRSAGVQKRYHVCQAHLAWQSLTRAPDRLWCCCQGLSARGGFSRDCREPGGCSFLGKFLQLSRCFYVVFLVSCPCCCVSAVTSENRDLLSRGMALPPQMPSCLNMLVLSVASCSKYPKFVPPALWVAACACCQADLCEITEFLVLFDFKISERVRKDREDSARSLFLS